MRKVLETMKKEKSIKGRRRDERRFHHRNLVEFVKVPDGGHNCYGCSVFQTGLHAGYCPLLSSLLKRSCHSSHELNDGQEYWIKVTRRKGQ
ncbi:hypothetical protein KAR91_38745 [Candidatus Pacearchaeota archaeon]|nr:hypothetical protein [Candidatus Pacearchaeota archaeon]